MEQEHRSLVKKAQQQLRFLRRLKKAGMSNIIMINFYRCVVESNLTNNITICFGSCCWQEGPTEGSKDCPEGHCIQSPIYGGHLQKSAVSQESNKYYKGQCSLRCWNSSAYFHLEEDSEVCDHELQDWEIVYFFRRSGYITSVADQCSHFVPVSLGGTAMDIGHYVMVRHCS